MPFCRLRTSFMVHMALFHTSFQEHTVWNHYGLIKVCSYFPRHSKCVSACVYCVCSLFFMVHTVWNYYRIITVCPVFYCTLHINHCQKVHVTACFTPISLANILFWQLITNYLHPKSYGSSFPTIYPPKKCLSACVQPTIFIVHKVMATHYQQYIQPKNVLYLKAEPIISPVKKLWQLNQQYI